MLPPYCLELLPSGITGAKGLGLPPGLVFWADVAQPHLGGRGAPPRAEGLLRKHHVKEPSTVAQEPYQHRRYSHHDPLALCFRPPQPCEESFYTKGLELNKAVLQLLCFRTDSAAATMGGGACAVDPGGLLPQPTDGETDIRSQGLRTRDSEEVKQLLH